MVGEDRHDQIDALVRRNGRVDQPFPGSKITRRKSQAYGSMIAGMNEKLTGQGDFAGLPKLPGASEGLGPSTVVSISTIPPLRPDVQAVAGARLVLLPTWSSLVKNR